MYDGTKAPRTAHIHIAATDHGARPVLLRDLAAAHQTTLRAIAPERPLTRAETQARMAAGLPVRVLDLERQAPHAFERLTLLERVCRATGVEYYGVPYSPTLAEIAERAVRATTYSAYRAAELELYAAAREYATRTAFAREMTRPRTRNPFEGFYPAL